MEFSSEEGEIPIPINSATSYGGGNNGHGHLIHHHHEPPIQVPHHMISNSSVLPVASAPPHNSGGGGGVAGGMEEEEEEEGHHQHGPYSSKKLVVKYRECLKNHAASMGGNATDGCGEFMPSGEEGTLEALTCSACQCHRNFHRKEVEGHEQQQHDHHFHQYLHHHHHHLQYHNTTNNHPYRLGGRKLLLPPPPETLAGYPTPPPGNILPSRMVMPYNVMGSHHSSLPSDLSDEQEDHHHHGIMRPSHHHHQNKKRFRTKFTQEQKEKMLDFAERVGWKIQKQEESVVQQFCQEIGVKRRVLKVWMHNNKHSSAKKINPTAPPPPLTATTPS
ncbi:zinc-finger homeodomain protein 3-like [Prosopis cineraria]|uniref:zinc-finger homeodomain protein 3-like n=1 Tax=Prosopis cineraria TaxID=364024 RepID=UPI00241069FE|nr:zinc-finger homeodomain protein 3-like [Prosopis cineraria]